MNFLKHRKLSTLMTLLFILPFVSSTLAADNGEIIQQIIEGHTLHNINVHGSSMRVLQSRAYEAYQESVIRKALEEKMLAQARPFIEQKDALKKRIANGEDSPEIQEQLAAAQSSISAVTNREHVIQIYRAISKAVNESERSFCHDMNQTTLRVMRSNNPSIKCIDNASADNIVQVSMRDPEAARNIDFAVSNATEEEQQASPIEEGKRKYYCYDRNVSILSKRDNCQPKKVWLTDAQLEKIGKKNCDPVGAVSKDDAKSFTPVTKLYNSCRDDICTKVSEQIDYSKFELVSFSQDTALQCTPDSSQSRVCAQAYHCKNKVYQVTCEFNDEEYVGSNKCHIKSISEETMKNKCKIIELGTEV